MHVARVIDRCMCRARSVTPRCIVIMYVVAALIMSVHVRLLHSAPTRIKEQAASVSSLTWIFCLKEEAPR